MSAQKSLPIVYQMAILMGARVEVWHEEMWKNVHVMAGITSSTPYKVVEEDSVILTAAKKALADNSRFIKFEEVVYVIPKVATVGDIVLIMYGLGVYIRLEQNGGYTVVEDKDFKDQAYLGRHLRAVFGDERF